MVAANAVAATHPINERRIRQWLPVTDEERNLRSPTIDPEAGAEALFWRVHIVDTYQGTMPQVVLYHYLRIKIFTKSACEKQGTREIPYGGRRAVLDVGGRTIKPDGTIVELAKDAIFRRDLVKAGGLKVKAVSFAMPAVEPGAIIEYHWREVRDRENAHYIRLLFQLDIPVHEVKYYIMPLEIPGYPLPPMRWVAFGAEPSPMALEVDDFSSTVVKNVPAYKEEPLMPPEWVVKPWELIYYADEVRSSPDKFWASQGKRTYSDYEPYLKVTNEVKQAAQGAVAGATSPEEKLAKLLQYCRFKIKMIGDDDLTEQQVEKDRVRSREQAQAQDNRPVDTLKGGIGTEKEVNLLFAAMARAVGFEARVARLGDRSDRPFDRSFLNLYFLRTLAIAVKVGEQWRFYDVAAKRLPIGMLGWGEEGSDALISDPKEPVFVPVPISDVDKSVRLRSGEFELDREGTLQGEVRMSYTGHAAAGRRQELATEAAGQREEDVREMVRRHYVNAEVSEAKVENVEDPEKPLVYSYRVKVPGYAQQTGKRLFVPLNYFEHGRAPRFTASERKHPVWFEYPWRDEDSITIKTPADFSWEDAGAPQSFSLGQTGAYEASAKVGNQQLVYHRKLEFGRGGQLVFQPAAYPLLKQAFETIHTQDEHTVTLRQLPTGLGTRK